MKSLVDILQLINSEGIGAVTFHKMVKKFGSVGAALESLDKKKHLFSRAQAEDEISKALNANAEIISFDSPEYPSSLLEIPDAPPVIYVKGNKKLLAHRLNMAIVGARNASINGRKIASRIAYDLTQNNVLVVSGMARGIDTSAHKGAMYALNQNGPTVTVLGTGVDVVYPLENAEIYEQIAEQGLIISEFSMGTPAQVSNFPRRNRIISGLCLGTLVVEATLKSGSLITARTALEQGKDVFAVPGSPLEPRSGGPNQLIRDGAVLTESAADILDYIALNSELKAKNQPFELLTLDNKKNIVNIAKQEKTAKLHNQNQPKLSEKHNIFELIDYQGIDIDELLRVSNLEQAEFFTQLMDLEMEGKIARQAGNRIARIK